MNKNNTNTRKTRYDTVEPTNETRQVRLRLDRPPPIVLPSSAIAVESTVEIYTPFDPYPLTRDEMHADRIQLMRENAQLSETVRRLHVELAYIQKMQAGLQRDHNELQRKHKDLQLEKDELLLLDYDLLHGERK